MFAALKTAAVLVPLIGGLGGGVAVASAGFWAWNNWVDNPGIVRTQEAICVTQVEKIAAESRLREEHRILAAGRLAAQEFVKQQLEAERQRLEDVEELENDITAYEKRLIALGNGRGPGGACSATADDIEFATGRSL